MTVTTTASRIVSSPATLAIPAPTGALNSIKQLVSSGDTLVQNIFSSNQTSINTHVAQIVQPCIATRGETFAIWLNVVYLAPLTYLFVSFFITSYVKRSTTKSNGKLKRDDNVTMAEKAGWDAARGVEKEVYGGEQMVNSDGTISKPTTPTKVRAQRA